MWTDLTQCSDAVLHTEQPILRHHAL